MSYNYPTPFEVARVFFDSLYSLAIFHFTRQTTNQSLRRFF